MFFFLLLWLVWSVHPLVKWEIHFISSWLFSWIFSFFWEKPYTKNHKTFHSIDTFICSYIIQGTFEISSYLLPMPWTIESENKQQLQNDHVADSRAQPITIALHCTDIHSFKGITLQRDWINHFEINWSHFAHGCNSLLSRRSWWWRCWCC